MRDHAMQCDEFAVRDALPDLLHGRLAAGDRERVEAHVAVCAACTAELGLVRATRTLLAGAGRPALDLDAVAAAVRDATRAPTHAPARAGSHTSDAAALAPARAATSPAPAWAATRAGRRDAAARPRWATRLTQGAGLRAAAALLVTVLGTGAVLLSRDGSPSVNPRAAVVVGPARPDAPTATAGGATPASAPATPSQVAARESDPAPPAHALGSRFDDLSDAELEAVLRAIEGDGATLPALDPTVTPAEYRGGGE